MSKIYLFTAKPVPGNKGDPKTIIVVGAKSKKNAVANHAVPQARDLVFDRGHTFDNLEAAKDYAAAIRTKNPATRTVVVDLNHQRAIGKLLGL